jgi:hypothetical protein
MPKEQTFAASPVAWAIAAQNAFLPSTRVFFARALRHPALGALQ